MTSLSLEQLAVARHPLPEWATFVELRAGTGYARASRRGSPEQRFDVAAFNCYPSTHGYRVVYEVKRSRGDFLRELKAPGKRAQAEGYFHETWFAVDRDVCTPEEVPDGWGLLVVTKGGDKLRTVKRARPRHAEEVPYSMVLSLLRATCGRLAERPTFDLDGETLTEHDLERLVRERTDAERQKLTEKVRAVAEEKRELELARAGIVEPLEHLMLRAHGWGLSRRRQAAELTPEDVDALIERAACRRAARMAGALSAAREELERIERGLTGSTPAEDAST